MGVSFEKDLERHFDLSNGTSLGAEVDYWMCLLALVACIETLVVCGLAVYRYSRKVYNLRLQRWTMRIILIGPIYSCLMWCSLWQTSLDYYIAIPVGFYEAYAFYCFYAMLVCFADGEDRLIAALSSGQSMCNGRTPTAVVYYPFGDCFQWSCGDHYTPLHFIGSRVHYVNCIKFQTARDLLRYLRRCVAQAMIVKPLNVAVMLVFSYYGMENYANYSRMLSIVSLWFVANALTQLYHVVLPRIRGLGGEKLFVLLVLMIAVIGVQDIVCSALLINSGTSSATDDFATRLIFIFTILEFTAFSTIFYRLLPPEKFAQMTWSNSNAHLSALVPPVAKTMAIYDFLWIIIDPTTIFAIPRGRESREPSFSGIQCIGEHHIYHPDDSDDAEKFGVKESKQHEEEDIVYDETSPLIKYLQ